MLPNGRHIKMEDYKGYEIIHYTMAHGYDTDYFYIAKRKERESCFCLNSIKAARNVIDTFHRAKTLPIYR